jgi:CHAD domain-containing protein
MIDIHNYFLAQVEEKYNQYKYNFEWCCREFSEESVHDLRVSIRRISSLCLLLDKFLANSYCLLLRKHLKKQLSGFSPLRDTQVMILECNKLAPEFPVLYPYRVALLDNERQYIKSVHAEIRNINTETSDIHKFYIIHSLRCGSNDLLTLANLKLFALDMYSELVSRFNSADPGDINTIHRVRLAYKKFRYIIEILAPFIDITDEDLKELKSHQTRMGNIQDNNVFVDSLEHFIDNQTTNPRIRFSDILYYKMAERKQLIDDFFLNFDSIQSFKDKLI